ncbi:MAG: cell division protein ZapA [Chitinophagaceae bacterium]
MVAINILLGDRTYRIKIEPKDEEAVRKAVKVINDQVIEFKTNFSGKDMQDYIAMVLVWFATQQIDPVTDQPQNGDLQTKLALLESSLDKALEAH